MYTLLRMLELVIVRHAIAFERDRSRWPDDRLRPLSPEGKQKFRKAASGLARWIPQVDRLLTSPLVRARETAELLTDVAGWPKAVECQPLEPETDPQELLSHLRGLKAKRIALVGHEPALSTFICFCVAGPPTTLHIEMKKGATARIAFSAAPSASSGTLTALVPPQALRRMA
jgi:phosphohistidine phosphatase